MRLEAVRAVDGLADGQGTEEAVRRAVSAANSRGTLVADSSSDGRGGRPRGQLVGRPGDRQVVVRADARRDGRLHPACGQVGGRSPGKHSRPPGFYPRVSPDFRGRLLLREDVQRPGCRTS